MDKKDMNNPTKKTNQPPLLPTALMNFKKTDDELAKIVGGFWQLVWKKENAAINIRTKYLLSLANAVGARRFRQATRELVKAYAEGTTVEELDELFSLFVWNQGAGEFSSEIGPSPLFAAYQLVKGMEKDGTPRETIVEELKKTFGESNPLVGTAYRLPEQGDSQAKKD
ncbi:hypothetical protein [Trichloromonas sp.]|uniref:hypothetical protein n=1 Tax=Trichloromonas sp. TaxID=3069249 RepID=UPI002A386534|nr:hypothetical protein [Trichloromonas sp.]